MLVKRENVVYFLFITLFVITFSLFWILLSPKQHTAIFLPFVACFAGFTGFFSAQMYLYEASFFSKFKWYRSMFRYCVWYKYKPTGMLPGLLGSFWTTEKLKPHRYYKLVDKEIHPKLKVSATSKWQKN